jgi:hypothetical protein
MKAEQNKKTTFWRYGDGDYIYKTEQEAVEKGRQEIAIKLKEILKDGRKVSNNK